MTRVPIVALLATALLAGGCLAQEDTPTATPDASITATPLPTVPPRDPGELVVAAPADPQVMVPPATDAAGALLGDLLYDPLYRLDPQLDPQPALASGLPAVSADGLTWTIQLRPGARFHDGAPVRAADAAFTLGLGSSASCPFGREVCGAVSANLADASGSTPQGLTVTLRAPWSPFLNTVLGQLPVLSEQAVTAATASIVQSASGLDPTTLQATVESITGDTNADRCLVDRPPTGCLLSDHVDELLAILAEAGVTPPAAERFLAPDGTLDAEAHGEGLLRAVAALATVLGSEGNDQLAAAIPLIDVARDPIGGGPYRLVTYVPGQSIELERHDGHVPDPAGSATLQIRIIRDAAAAATALRAGEVDWLLEVDPEQAASLGSEAGFDAAARPAPIVRSIVYNVRSDRVFADPVARRAVAQCIDRPALVDEATGGVAVPAAVELAAGSWAAGDATQPQPDPSAATASLDAAGWTRGSDGIYARGGVRLSAEIFVRPTRIDLVTFAQGAAEQLQACGIELLVQDLDLTGEVLLTQLQWPNEFDTVLVSRDLGVDPDQDMAAFESSHATSADNPADANPGGYQSTVVDGLLAQARQMVDQAARASLYAQAIDALEEDPPSLPIWYEPTYAALSSGVVGESGVIDPALPRYWWDAWSWRTATP